MGEKGGLTVYRYCYFVYIIKYYSLNAITLVPFGILMDVNINNSIHLQIMTKTVLWEQEYQTNSDRDLYD